MNLENKGENIIKAFNIVYKTYENCEKLMDAIRQEYDKSQFYLCTDNKFLRYKSDNDVDGWLVRSFIMVFQKKDDGEQFENSFYDSPFYVVEINFDGKKINNIDDIPYIFVAKLYYDSNEVKTWSGFSPADHWGIYHPLHTHDEWWNTMESNGIIIRKPKNEYQYETDRYWKIERVLYTYFPLLDVTGNNFKEKIFSEIEKLSRIN